MKDDSVTPTDSLKPIASPGRRAASYWFVDGLPDLMFGLALILFGTAGLLWRMYAPHPWNRFYFVLIAGGFMLLFWKGRETLDFLKSRVTYPRTGYAQPPEEPPTRDKLITLSIEPRPPADENVTYFNTWTVTVIWWFFFLTFNQEPFGRWAAPVVMPVLAATLYALNRSSERPFRWWSALILALTGPVFLWVDPPPLVQPLLPLMLAGGWLAVQGACTLAGYMRANPYPQASGGVRA
jgi:hypothetical protein